MYMRNKPVKFGMKIWFLASAHGNAFSFNVYTGKDMSSSEPLGEQVVNKLIEVLEKYSNHAIFLTIFLVQQPFVEIWLKRAYDVSEIFAKTEHKSAHCLFQR